MIVCDLTDRESFNHVKTWHQSIQDRLYTAPPIFLVANKSDDTARLKVTEAEVAACAQKLNLAGVSIVSAKTGVGVNETFTELIRAALSHPHANILAQLEKRIAELSREKLSFFSRNKGDIKGTKITALQTLKQRLTDDVTTTVAEQIATIRKKHPAIDAGFFSHRTRDLLNSFIPSENTPLQGPKSR